MLMFSVGVVVGGMHFISKVPPEGTVIGSTTYSARQLQTGLMIVSVPLFFFSSTIGTIFYIIGKLSFSFILFRPTVWQQGLFLTARLVPKYRRQCSNHSRPCSFHAGGRRRRFCKQCLNFNDFTTLHSCQLADHLISATHGPPMVSSFKLEIGESLVSFLSLKTLRHYHVCCPLQFDPHVSFIKFEHEH